MNDDRTNSAAIADPIPAGQQLAVPLVRSIQLPDPIQCLRRLAGIPGCMLLHSAQRDRRLARYSLLVADPFDWCVSPVGAAHPLDWLQQQLARFVVPRLGGLPPFQGGAAGLLGYELNRSLETLPPGPLDEFAIPALAMGMYDVVLAWDHADDQTWLISQGFPETEPAARRRQAIRRADQFQHWIFQAAPAPRPAIRGNPSVPLGPRHAVDRTPGLCSAMTELQYLDAVNRTIEFVRAGDVFQVNIAQRLLCQSDDSPLDIYARLCQCNPAPFAAYFDLGHAQVLSASPERFLSVRDRMVETRPIKGTRRRTRLPEVDVSVAAQLRSSPKDCAENVMIVDLMRNDLSRVCEDSTVKVAQLLKVEHFASVMHLVSAVEGKLRTDATLVDLIRAVFPGGSVTGAPKIRAMQIINQLEPVARGAYCGCLGYFGFDGTADLNMLIRTITASAGWLQIPVGGGIVAHSTARQEYEETWTKAAGMLRAVFK